MDSERTQHQSVKCQLHEHVICGNMWALSGVEQASNSGIKSLSFISLLFKVTEVDGATTCMFIGC